MPIIRRKETPVMKRIALTLVLVLALVGAALAFVGRDKEKNLPPTRTVVMSMKDYTFNDQNPKCRISTATSQNDILAAAYSTAPRSISSVTVLRRREPPNRSAYPSGVHSTISPGRW